MSSNIRKSFLAFGLIVSIFTFVFISTVNAQTSLPSEIPEIKEQVSVTVEPTFPDPNQLVTITLEAFGTDLNKATITWTVNGSSIESGKGVKQFKVNAPNAGQSKKVGIRITPVSGPVITKTVTIAPQTTDIIWEAKTYTPPFYRGKAMYTPREEVTVVALPSFTSETGASLNPNALIYKWRNNGEVAGDASGYGRNVYKVKGSILLKENYLDVEITSQGKEKSRKKLTLIPSYPEVYLYENNPLYGLLLNDSLEGQEPFDVEEKNIAAIPYFFGTDKKNAGNLTYDWNINGVKITTGSNQSEMNFRNTEGKEGKSLVGVRVNNSSNFLQEGRGDVYLNLQESKKIFDF